MSEGEELARPIEILLVEDNPGDVLLTIDALRESKVWCQVTVASDGLEAMALLNGHGEHTEAHCPDLILLDLNLPRKDGRQVLAELKSSETLRAIPVVVLTESRDTADLVRSWALQVDGYIRKPIDLEQFVQLVQDIASFWLVVVTVPRHEPATVA
jgi:two-component system, chemotaxis family, response regulator Rcp1